MTNVIERAQAIIDQITEMEQSGVHKEKIELIAQQARAELKIATLLPPMHPVLLEFNQLLHKYLVE